MTKKKKAQSGMKPLKMELDLEEPWRGSQSIQLKIRIPCEIVMLCKLMDVSAGNILSALLSCLAVENFKNNPEAAKQHCIDFFIHYGFGSDYYTEEDIRTMFAELAKINDLFPDEKASDTFLDVHCDWREKYYEYWFNKWYWKTRRKDVVKI